MKVARKLPKTRRDSAGRATLKLSLEVYRKIDELRGDETRSAWVQRLVEREEQKWKRKQFAEKLRAQYTPRVCRETLAVHGEFPVHPPAA